MHRLVQRTSCAALLALATLSCDGPSIPRGGPAATPESLIDETAIPEAQGCDAPKPGPAPLRRLSNYEYTNTLTDLLGDAELVAEIGATFSAEPISLGFRNNAEALKVSHLLADQYLEAAVAVGQAAPSIEGLLPCDAADGDEECGAAYIDDLAPRAYRRPLEAAERERYVELFETVYAEEGFGKAIETITAALLSSTHFLFRVELDQVGDEPSGPAPYEMASRLSYLLWQSMPDAELFAAADDGRLGTRDGIEEQVLRMVEDPKSERLFEFFLQWLDLDELASFDRDGTAYPDVPSDLPELLERETRAFVLHLITEGGTFADLMSAPYTFVNATLGEHYGLDGAPGGDDFERVDAPTRAGVLTQGALLVHDRPTRSSIVRRGLKLRTDFLCQLVPAPPDDVDPNLGPLSSSLTQRERLELHRSSPQCQGCHALIDPLGTLFEGYDATGRERTVDEVGGEVVTGTSVVATRDLDGDYATAVEFARAMGQSDHARECFTTQAFRFFYGRDLTDADGCTQRQLMSGFQENDYRILDLVLSLTRTDQFLYRQTSSPEDAAEEMDGEVAE